MPSALHEQLLDLLRSRPALAADLLARVGGLPIDPGSAAAARTGSQTFSELRPPEYRADLVAAWCARVVEMGGMRLRSVVVGPKDVPVITDPKAARAAEALSDPDRWAMLSPR